MSERARERESSQRRSRSNLDVSSGSMDAARPADRDGAVRGIASAVGIGRSIHLPCLFREERDAFRIEGLSFDEKENFLSPSSPSFPYYHHHNSRAGTKVSL